MKLVRVVGASASISLCAADSRESCRFLRHELYQAFQDRLLHAPAKQAGPIVPDHQLGGGAGLAEVDSWGDGPWILFPCGSMPQSCLRSKLEPADAGSKPDYLFAYK